MCVRERESVCVCVCVCVTRTIRGCTSALAVWFCNLPPTPFCSQTWLVLPCLTIPVHTRPWICTLLPLTVIMQGRTRSLLPLTVVRPALSHPVSWYGDIPVYGSVPSYSLTMIRDVPVHGSVLSYPLLWSGTYPSMALYSPTALTGRMFVRRTYFGHFDELWFVS